MAIRRITEGHTGSHGYSRESAEPFALASLRETFLSYPPDKQEQIRHEVAQRLRDELLRSEFAARDGHGRRPGSALARYAWEVYGVRITDGT